MANPIVEQVNRELENVQEQIKLFKPTVEYLNDAKANVDTALKALGNSEKDFYQKAKELQRTYDAFIKLNEGIEGVLTKIDSIDFPERLTNIEESNKETIAFLEKTRETTLLELQKASEVITKADFEGKFSNLNMLISSASEANQQLVTVIEGQKLPEKIEGFGKNVSITLTEGLKEVNKSTERISTDSIKLITDLNLPSRIDKLDANIAGILSSIQNTQSRLETLERNLSDKIKELSVKQYNSINNLQSQLISKLSQIEASNDQYAKKAQLNTFITWGLIVAATLALAFIR